MRKFMKNVKKNVEEKMMLNKPLSKHEKNKRSIFQSKCLALPFSI